MAQYKALRGSYWEDYPVPENPARCFARRTLHEAFGGTPTLLTPSERPRGGRWWAVAAAGATIGALTVLGRALAAVAPHT